MTWVNGCINNAGKTIAVTTRIRKVRTAMKPATFVFFIAKRVKRRTAKDRKMPPGIHPDVFRKVIVRLGNVAPMSSYIARNFDTTEMQKIPEANAIKAMIIEKGCIIYW